MTNSYAYLDQNEFQILYRGSKISKRMKFFVEGVRCARCVGKIESLKSRFQSVQSLEVDLSKQTVELEMKSSNDSVSEVAQAISDLGYKAVPVRFDEDESNQWKQESRRDLRRLAVAGFCAGQIMMLAFAGYFGDLGSLQSTFAWLQLALYLPVVGYVALPFYQGFIGGLKTKSLSIDGPMAIASLLGFLVSTWNLIQGKNSIYFDSLSGFLFLILATRFWQKRARYQYLKYLRPSALAETLKARKLVDGREVWTPSAMVRTGEQVLVQQDEWVPVDGRLLEAEAVFDLSVLDGESYPRKVHQGFSVKAGSRLISGQAKLETTASGAQTFLASLLTGLRFEHSSKSETASLSDRASQWLLITVLSMAGILIVTGFGGDFQSHFEKALALIILACPCAMAFGTPLASAFAMKRLQEDGVVLKSSAVLDRMKGIRKVFLDKTGTVTEKIWKVDQSSEKDVLQSWMSIILSLEAQSQHPIAFALREIWKDVRIPASFAVEEWRENSSRGVQGRIQGVLWKFHSFRNERGEKIFGLWREEELVWRFRLSPMLHPEARKCVQRLQEKGLEVFLLSGDSLSECRRIAAELGISESHVRAEVTPEQKAEILRHHPDAMMVGDGFNDALAMQAAAIGVAVKGGVDLALRSADALILNEGLQSLLTMFDLSEQARRQIRRNLLSALIYNLLGAGLAIGGYVNPFVAALLMPASSMFIWSSTWWGLRR